MQPTDQHPAPREAEPASNSAESGPDGTPQPDGVLARFVEWATSPDGRASWLVSARRRARRHPLLTALAGAISLALIGALVLFAVIPGSGRHGQPPRPNTQQMQAGPAAPAIASQLAEQANNLNRSDPLTELQLRLAAYTLDPGNSTLRSTLAQLLLGPRPMGDVTTTVGPITALAFAESGRLAAAGQTGVQEITGDQASMTTSAPMNADGVSAIAYAGGGRLVAATSGGVRELPAASTATTEVAFALVRLGTTGWAATTRDGRLVVWDGATPSGPARVLTTGLAADAPLVATPDGRFVFVPGLGGVAVWQVATGTVAATVPIDGSVSALSVGGQGKLLLVGQNSAATLWDITDPARPQKVAVLDRPSATVAVAPDGHTALTSGTGTTAVWELPTSGDPALIGELPVGDGHVASAYRADSAVLATGVGDRVKTWSIAELLVYRPAEVESAVLLHASLPVTEPVTVAATNKNASFLITGGTGGKAGVWSTRHPGVSGPRLEHAGSLSGPFSSIDAVGGDTTTVVTVGPPGVAVTAVTTPAVVFPTKTLAANGDTAAVTPDGHQAVIVDGTTGTVYDLEFQQGAVATISYPLPTTALAFAPQGTALIAGHGDGSVTVHTIQLEQEHASRLHLDGGASSPIDAVALSDNAAVALGVHEDGTISVFGISAGANKATAVLPSAAGAGPHRAWLSPSGEFAIVSNPGHAVLWSLVDRQHPAELATLVAGDAAVPVLVSGDGTTAVQIGHDNALTLWDLHPVLGVADNPTERACHLADLGYDRWRQIVPDTAFNTPCLPPPLPQLDPTSSSIAPGP